MIPQNLSKIILTDKELLHRSLWRFRPDSKNYEDSWGYIIQATRYNGLRWYDEHTGSLIFFSRKSEADPTLVIPNFFAEFDYLRSVISTVLNELKEHRVILKNINPEDISKLLPLGFRQYTDEEAWYKGARFDDQTYPQLIIDLKKVIEKRGKAYKKLRTALNKKPKILIRNYTENDKESVLKILASKDGNTLNDPLKLTGMYFASHIMYLQDGVERYVITDANNGKVIGFTATSEINTKNTALIAIIFEPKVKVASIWGIYQTLVLKFKEGYQYVNLGGSEKIESHNFLRRTFVAREQLVKAHMIYESANK